MTSCSISSVRSSVATTPATTITCTGWSTSVVQRDKITIAGCFYDLGIWSAGCFGYLAPSVKLARRYLAESSLTVWTPRIETMIDQHHKLGPYRDDPLVETLRKGDLVDFSLGILKCGLPAEYVQHVESRFANAGFHRRLVGLAAGWLSRHPLDPLPVLKW